MLSALCSIAAATGLLVGGDADHGFGCLWTNAEVGRRMAEPYVPHEGDILFYDDQNIPWTFLYWMGGTAPPFHVGIVVKRPDGSAAVLEAGADDKPVCHVLDLAPRMSHFEGVIQIRRCKATLTPEQSEQLTAFAMAQEGKQYAVTRLILQLTPLRSRGYFHKRFYAATYCDRQRWVCAEIVVSAGTLVGLFDPAVVKATAIYPLDIVDDHLYKLSPVYEEAHYWSPGP